MSDQLAGAMETVARALLGEPNKAMSKKTELRFGRQGSVSVDLSKGVFHDHENDAKGGVLDLIEWKTGQKGAEAFEWLREHGVEVGDRPKPNGHAKPNGAYRNGNGADHDHGEPDERAPEARAVGKTRKEIVATYDFRDLDSSLLYQEVRSQIRLPDGSWEMSDKGKPKKEIRQRRPNPDKHGEWIWNLEGVEHGLYNFAEIHEEMLQPEDERRTVFLPEGPAKCDALKAWGMLATSNSGGAKNWKAHHAQELRGADVVLLNDNDDAGRKRGDTIAASLRGVARRVRVLDFDKFWPACPPKGDVVDWIKAGGTKAELYEIVEKLPEWKAPPYKSKFGAVPWSQLGVKPSPYRWLIRGIVPANERLMIFGESGSGKSLTGEEIGVSIARKLDYAGCKTTQAGVIYCAFEGGKGFVNRVEGYRQYHGLSSDDGTPFVMLTRSVDIFGDEATTKDLLEEISDWAGTFTVPLGLIIFDTVSASAGAMEENEGSSVAKYLMKIREIGSRFNCAVMLVHHTAKASGTTPRGSGKWTGDLETTIEVGKDPDGALDENGRPIRVVKLQKQREGEGHREIKRFVIRQIEIGADDEGQPIRTCITLPPGETPAVRSVDGRRVFTAEGKNDKIICKALFLALEQQGIVPPPDLPIPAHVQRVVHYKEWVAAYKRLDSDVEEDIGKRNRRMKTAMQRVGAKLLDAGVIGRENPWIWTGTTPVRGFPSTFPKPKVVARTESEPIPNIDDSEF